MLPTSNFPTIPFWTTSFRDKEGNFLVCDTGNDRVQVSEWKIYLFELMRPESKRIKEYKKSENLQPQS